MTEENGTVPSGMALVDVNRKIVLLLKAVTTFSTQFNCETVDIVDGLSKRGPIHLEVCEMGDETVVTATFVYSGSMYVFSETRDKWTPIGMTTPRPRTVFTELWSRSQCADGRKLESQ